MANVLAQIAQVNIDEFAKEMFSVSTNIKDKAMEEVMKTDIKAFELEDHKVAISQVILYDFEALSKREVEIQEALQTVLSQIEASTLCVAFTSILDNESKFYAAGEYQAWIEEAFPDGKGILSRKNQIVPILTEVFSHH